MHYIADHLHYKSIAIEFDTEFIAQYAQQLN